MFYTPIGYNEAWFEPGIFESLHIELRPAYLEEAWFYKVFTNHDILGIANYQVTNSETILTL